MRSENGALKDSFAWARLFYLRERAYASSVAWEVGFVCSSYTSLMVSYSEIADSTVVLASSDSVCSSYLSSSAEGKLYSSSKFNL